MENWFAPDAPASLPPAGSVLVVAPHPDDEVFGCGGCAALYASTGAHVQAFILTDGGGYLAGAQRQLAIETRRGESLRAAALLGMQAPVFGHWTDRHLCHALDLVARLVDMIESTGAEIVFAPSLWEIHPDHRAAAWATVTALCQRTESGATVPTLAFYEVGAPLRPTHLVDITNVFDTKKQAMACFKSQLAHQRYDVHIAALNTFRTYTLAENALAAEALAVIAPQDLQAFASAYGENTADGLARMTETALQSADESVEILRTQNVVQQQTMDSLNIEFTTLLGTSEQLRRQDHELRKQLHSRDHQLAEFEALLQARDHQLAEFEALLQARDHQLAEFQASLQSRAQQLAELQASLQEVLASRSWRITRPLRWLAGCVSAPPV